MEVRKTRSRARYESTAEPRFVIPVSLLHRLLENMHFSCGTGETSPASPRKTHQEEKEASHASLNRSRKRPTAGNALWRIAKSSR